MHDVIIILGFFAFFQWEFNLTVLAAVLAVLGYSVNESVVVFDRVRENFRRMRKAKVEEVINNAITRTMSRTIMTHLSTQTVVISMLIFGGEILKKSRFLSLVGVFELKNPTFLQRCSTFSLVKIFLPRNFVSSWI